MQRLPQWRTCSEPHKGAQLVRHRSFCLNPRDHLSTNRIGYDYLRSNGLFRGDGGGTPLHCRVTGPRQRLVLHGCPTQELDMWMFTRLETVCTHVVLPNQRNALTYRKYYFLCVHATPLGCFIAHATTQASSFIVFDVLRKPRKNRFTTYHQLVLGISVYDMISSVAYMLVAVMAPHEAGFHLSRGNDATCTLQGFMIQLGQTSMFYNVCLSLYFLLVIVCNWKERMFRRLCLASHMLVFVLGAGLAFGAIPFIGPQFGVCGVLPPLTTSQWQVSLFYTGPVSFTLVVLAVATAVICYKVYQQQKKAKKWMANVSAKLSRRVFWQSFWCSI